MNELEEWIKKQIDKIDSNVEDFLDDSLGGEDLDDSDIQEYIADEIDTIMQSTFGSETDWLSNELEVIIAKILIKEYINLMFKEWYTGDSNIKDYYREITETLGIN